MTKLNSVNPRARAEHLDTVPKAPAMRSSRGIPHTQQFCVSRTRERHAWPLDGSRVDVRMGWHSGAIRVGSAVRVAASFDGAAAHGRCLTRPVFVVFAVGGAAADPVALENL